MIIKITDITIQNMRFPSVENDNISAAYITIHTNKPQLQGHSLVFTNENIEQSVNELKHNIIGKTLSELTNHMDALDHQLRSLSAEKRIAIVNAVWDLWARKERKPLWRLIVDMSPEELIHCIDFKPIAHLITADEALAILRRNALTKSKRVADLLISGYPAYSVANSARQVAAKKMLGVSDSLAELLVAAKLGEPIRLSVSEVGSCAYLQHLAMVDYIYISASLESRALEYVEHLHEHFEDPVNIKNGHYQLPTLPGYSIKIKHQSLVDYSFPMGRMWHCHEDKTTGKDGSRSH